MAGAEKKIVRSFTSDRAFMARFSFVRPLDSASRGRRFR
jgi:hypothetical protein